MTIVDLKKMQLQHKWDDLTDPERLWLMLEIRFVELGMLPDYEWMDSVAEEPR